MIKEGEKMLFSIVIPVYNGEKYIGECIESILNQSINEYEIIIVDDGSTDSTFSLCKEYVKNYRNIRLFHQENKGVVFARAKGAAMAKGEYLLFCDSDDKIYSKTLELIRNVILETHSEVITFNMARHIEKLKEIQVGSYYNKLDIENKIFPFLLENKYGKYFNNNLCLRCIQEKFILV